MNQNQCQFKDSQQIAQCIMRVYFIVKVRRWLVSLKTLHIKNNHNFFLIRFSCSAY